MKNLLLITIALLGLSTSLEAQNIEFYRGMNISNYSLINSSPITKEIRITGDFILHDGAQVLGDNYVIYCRNFIIEGDAAFRHDSPNFLIVYQGYTNAEESPIIAKKNKNTLAKNIIPFLKGDITVFRNGKVYITGDYNKVSKCYLTQGKYVVVYDNGDLTANFVVKS